MVSMNSYKRAAMPYRAGTGEGDGRSNLIYNGLYIGGNGKRACYMTGYSTYNGGGDMEYMRTKMSRLTALYTPLEARVSWRVCVNKHLWRGKWLRQRLWCWEPYYTGPYKIKLGRRQLHHNTV
jgi:hypothetical protein